MIISQAFLSNTFLPAPHSHTPPSPQQQTPPLPAILSNMDSDEEFTSPPRLHLPVQPKTQLVSAPGQSLQQLCPACIPATVFACWPLLPQESPASQLSQLNPQPVAVDAAAHATAYCLWFCHILSLCTVWMQPAYS